MAEALVLDRVTMAYHHLKKAFIIDERTDEKTIQDILALYDVRNAHSHPFCSTNSVVSRNRIFSQRIK